MCQLIPHAERDGRALNDKKPAKHKREMFPQRRARPLLVAALIFIVLYFYYSGDARYIQNQQFYRSTVKAIEAQRNAVSNAAAEQPKPAVPEAPHPEIPKAQQPEEPKHDGSKPEMQEVPIAGRTKMTVPKNKEDASKQEQGPVVDDLAETKDELNGILKRSPIIIFSKSYCPFSAKAKHILLDNYSIVPAPYVVELDHHRLGKKLQAVLADTTGRRTVPNVLVNGKSIGGGDDMSALDEMGQMASTLTNLGGKWIQQVTRHEHAGHTEE